MQEELWGRNGGGGGSQGMGGQGMGGQGMGKGMGGQGMSKGLWVMQQTALPPKPHCTPQRTPPLGSLPPAPPFPVPTWHVISGLVRWASPYSHTSKAALWGASSSARS